MKEARLKRVYIWTQYSKHWFSVETMKLWIHEHYNELKQIVFCLQDPHPLTTKEVGQFWHINLYFHIILFKALWARSVLLQFSYNYNCKMFIWLASDDTKNWERGSDSKMLVLLFKSTFHSIFIWLTLV
jgi:hypothetical protein